MIQIEKIQRSPYYHPSSATPARIGFVVNQSDQRSSELSIELQACASRHATVQVRDQHGQVIMNEKENLQSGQHRLIYRMQHLQQGTYFFEVSDGFYHQVKELQVAAE